MKVSPDQATSAIRVSMVGAGLVTAQFVAGKAARDAIYLAQLHVASLPTIVIVTAVVSILLAGLSSKLLHERAPAVVVPAAFVVSAGLFMVEWALAAIAPAAAARALYLHVSGLGPMLGSGFWLIVTERFDPHTARQRFGQIAGAGTAGGLIGAVVAARVGVIIDIWAMLPLLAVANLLCAWQIRRFATTGGPSRIGEDEMSPELMADPPQSGLRVLASTPYLQQLAALVLFGSVAAALADYAFKVQAAGAFTNERSLVRFFAGYYAAISVITFVIQLSSSRFALEKLGLAFASSTPSLALFVGGAGAIGIPGLAAATVARGGESILRGSLFRSGYEVFYTPIPPREKRAAKSIIDVGVDRVGDAVGGAGVRLVQLLPVSAQYSVIMTLAVGCSALAMVVASRLSRGYVLTLERSLLNRAVELELSDVPDTLTRTIILQTLPPRPSSGGRRSAVDQETTTDVRVSGIAVQGLPVAPRARGAVVKSGTTNLSLDPELADIVELRSRDADRVRRVLRRDLGMAGVLVPHAVSLLAWEPVAADAIFALKKVAEERIGELVDALVDPNQPFAVRRRLARVFSICVSQRAVDGLILGLEDMRFEVRFQCGRSLAAILDRNRTIRIDQKTVFEVVQREVAVGRPVWQGRQLLDRLDDPDARTFVDEFLEDRANQSLAHVFALLALVLPADPLKAAFRALHTNDQRLRGTALEYLEGVLPPTIRQRLWPFLEDRRVAPGVTRSRDEIVADLLRSNQSIVLNLEELKRRADADRPVDADSS